MKNPLNTGVLALALFACAPAIAQADQFPDSDVSSACRRWDVIAPSDTVDLVRLPKAIYVGGAGDIKMIGVDAAANATGVVWVGVPAASMLPVRPRRILATGTSATNLLGCF